MKAMKFEIYVDEDLAKLHENPVDYILDEIIANVWHIKHAMEEKYHMKASLKSQPSLTKIMAVKRGGLKYE